MGLLPKLLEGLFHHIATDEAMRFRSTVQALDDDERRILLRAAETRELEQGGSRFAASAEQATAKRARLLGENAEIGAESEDDGPNVMVMF